MAYTRTNDKLAKIPIFDGADRTKCYEWLRKVQRACEKSDGHRDFLEELKELAAGPVKTTLSQIDPGTSDNDIISKVCLHHSDVPNKGAAMQRLMNITPLADEGVTSFAHRFTDMHYRATKVKPEDETSRPILERFATAIHRHARKHLPAWLYNDQPNTYGDTLRTLISKAIAMDEDYRLRGMDQKEPTVMETTHVVEEAVAHNPGSTPGHNQYSNNKPWTPKYQGNNNNRPFNNNSNNNQWTPRDKQGNNNWSQYNKQNNNGNKWTPRDQPNGEYKKWTPRDPQQDDKQQDEEAWYGLAEGRFHFCFGGTLSDVQKFHHMNAKKMSGYKPMFPKATEPARNLHWKSGGQRFMNAQRPDNRQDTKALLNELYLEEINEDYFMDTIKEYEIDEAMLAAYQEDLKLEDSEEAHAEPSPQ